MSWVGISIFILVVPIVIYVVAQISIESPSLGVGTSFETVYIALILMGSTFNPAKQSTRLVYGRYYYPKN